MPATSLRIKKEDSEHRLMFITDPSDGYITVNIYACNEEFIPVGKPQVIDLQTDEETYHRSLRKDSNEKGHFVAGHSTNPEWNEGYIPHIDENYTC